LQNSTSGGWKVRKNSLLRTFERPSRPDVTGKAVKIELQCVVKWEKRNSREL
jgi:hypothetical protein